MNILSQSNLPLPHLLYPKIQSAKSTLMNMVNTGETSRTRTELLPLELVDENTKFGAYTNKYMEDESYTFTVNELSKSRHFTLTRVRTRQDTIDGRLLC